MPFTTCYTLKCLTNLHAGSGDSGMGIIDKMIQRDSITELPVIYASSLKGAFREYFEEGPERTTLEPISQNIFGAKVNNNGNEGTNSKGSHVFHEAQLLGIPLGCNKTPFYIATSKNTLSTWIKKAKLFNISIEEALIIEINSLPSDDNMHPKILGQAIPDLFIGEFANISNLPGTFLKLKQLLGDNILLLNHNDFKEQCSDYNLPVISRNNLENGESKNLWYEQIVPHQSIFVFYTLALSDLNEDRFCNGVNSKVIQIGANSSLGYGYCEINKL